MIRFRSVISTLPFHQHNSSKTSFQNKCSSMGVTERRQLGPGGEMWRTTSVYWRTTVRVLLLISLCTKMFQDVILLLSTIEHGNLDEKIDWIFRLIDSSGSGLVSLKDFQEYALSVQDLTGATDGWNSSLTRERTERTRIIFQVCCTG